MSPTHFAHKNILIGEVSGEWRDIPRAEEIKEKDSRKDYGLGMGDFQNGQRKGRKKKKNRENLKEVKVYIWHIYYGYI